MIKLKEAKELVTIKLKEMEKFSKLELVILSEETIEFEFGWMFFYQSRKYIETGDFIYALGGNAPIIVDKYTSAIIGTGTRKKWEFYIEKYCEFRDNIERFYEEIRG